jgi:hypothetical protein
MRTIVVVSILTIAKWQVLPITSASCAFVLVVQAGRASECADLAARRLGEVSDWALSDTGILALDEPNIAVNAIRICCL